MEENKRETDSHRIFIEDRKKLRITGVEDVESFDDDSVVIYTVEGSMTVTGADFRINKLNIENGELEIDGELDSIRYSGGRRDEHGGFWGRIFR